MKEFFNKIGLVIKDKSLRGKILFILGALIVFRALAAIPVPGIDTSRLQSLFDNNQLLGLLNLFSGGGLSALSIVMLGVGPYITSSIIMQLLTMMSDKLKSLCHEEGDIGRKKFSQYSRMLTVPIALLQSVGFLTLLSSQQVIPTLDTMSLVVNAIVVTAGSLLLMWLGELMTEFGISNGTSIIIFAGIVAGLPGTVGQMIFTFTPDKIPTYLVFLVVGIVIILSVVFVSEAERPIPVTYSKQVRGGGVATGGVSTYIPIRINQAGVMPIIFALAVLLLPQMILGLLSSFNYAFLASTIDFLNDLFANQVFYGFLYFILVFLFTFFYTSITFEPHTIADNLQKGGAFIPGVRPGEPTSDHIGKIAARTTFVGATFLGLIAVIPSIVQGATGISQLTIGGTALLIVVSVVTDIVKKTEAQLSVKEY